MPTRWIPLRRAHSSRYSGVHSLLVAREYREWICKSAMYIYFPPNSGIDTCILGCKIIIRLLRHKLKIILKLYFISSLIFQSCKLFHQLYIFSTVGLFMNNFLFFAFSCFVFKILPFGKMLLLHKLLILLPLNSSSNSFLHHIIYFLK